MMDWKEINQSDYKYFGDHCFQVGNNVLICPIDPNRNKLDGVFQINHSCDPNCGFRGQIMVVAMRDIQIGEEIAYDYAMTDANYSDVSCTNMICLCGTKLCRNVITGEDWKLGDLQERYKGYFSQFIQNLIKKV